MPSALAADGLWETPKKKIVASSWDLGCATIEEVAAQADLFDETGLDGVVVRVPYVTGPLARERGRQIGRAMFGEFPEMRVLSFWFLSLNKSYANSDDPVAVMRAEGDLWPMFINGLLDVMPPAARLVDGDEHGYWYRTGLFGSSRKAAEGEAYVAEAYSRGDGVGTFTVRWKKDGTWNWNMPGTDAAFGAPDAKGWRRASIKFRVQHGVNEPVLKINLAQQEGQKAAFDRIVLYKVD